MRGKTVLVTGASSGIGRDTALRFAAEGARVIGVARSEAALEELRKEAFDFEGEILIHVADLSDRKKIDRLVSRIGEELGGLDVLINCAGIISSGPMLETTLEDWDEMLNINLRMVFYLTKECTKHLINSKGNIVNVSSVAGTRAFPNLMSYCVSKAGIDQFTRCAALELAPKGVRVNAVNPGVVVSKLHRRGGMSDEQYSDFLEHSKSTHPLGRTGESTEVAELIFFLASENAGWITGVTYEIDGGRAQTCAR